MFSQLKEIYKEKTDEIYDHMNNVDMSLIKFAAVSMGVLAGLAVSEDCKKPVRLGACVVYSASMSLLITRYRKMREAEQLPGNHEDMMGEEALTEDSLDNRF